MTGRLSLAKFKLGKWSTVQRKKLKKEATSDV